MTGPEHSGEHVQRLLLKAPLSTHSGWGQDGIGIAAALARAGRPPFLLPLEVAPPLPPSVAQLLTRPLRPPFDLLIAHVAADRSGLPPAELSASRHRVLWSMWEWTTFANHPEEDSIRQHVTGYDAVVAYDPVSVGAFRSLGPSIPPVVTAQGGIDAAAWPHIERQWRPPVRFLLLGHITDRKDPLAALHAFTALRRRHGSRFNAELHFKFVDRMNPLIVDPDRHDERTGDRAAVPEPSREYLEAARRHDRVFVHMGTWSRESLLRLYGQMHCLLAPSRGEGKNLAALEFMATGGTVIATSFGGHSVWLDHSYAYPLQYRLRPATWPVPTSRAEEADADVAHLQDLMWRVCSDLDEARTKGRTAAAVIPAEYDWRTALRRLGDALSDLGITGPRIDRSPP